MNIPPNLILPYMLFHKKNTLLIIFNYFNILKIK
jgi:hypothetical protein